MNREVYKYMLATYGKAPGVWISAFLEVVRTLIVRVLAIILIGKVASYIAEGDLESARKYVILASVWIIIGTIIGAAGTLIGIKSENMVYHKLVPVYYEKLTNKDLEFFRDNHTGYLTTLFRNYLDSGIVLVRILRGAGVRNLVTLIVPIFVFMSISIPLGLIALGLAVTQLVYIFWSSGKANIYRKNSHEIYRRITGEVADDITNIVAYKSSGSEAIHQKRLMKLREKELDAYWLRHKLDLMLDLPRSIFATLFIGLGFWFALESSSSTSQIAGSLLVTVTLMFQILRTVNDVPDTLSDIDDQVTKLHSTLEVLSSKYEKITDQSNPKEFNLTKPNVEINNINFTYGSDGKSKSVFKNFNLSLKSGEHIGVVGLSGAGKSTLASLLMRFDEVDSGSIIIGGFDIKNIKQSDLRSKIAYVPQEPLLFHRTIKENIAYNNFTATDAEIVKASRVAHAHEFIKEFHDAYDTMVGERGVKLSGGQKQRIVIARAVLKNASIVLFDEATSALDSESEQIIQEALPQIITGKTAIIIAHRLSTVAGLDRIIVIHGGIIEEEGTHQELLDKKGRYFDLWQRQTLKT